MSPRHESEWASLGQAIRAQIALNGHTYASLAEATGVARSTLQRRINARPGSFTASEFDAIVEALGTTMQHLIDSANRIEAAQSEA